MTSFVSVTSRIYCWRDMSVVKSNVKPMPKSRRKVEVDRDLLRRFLELQRESRETDRKLAEVLADIRLLRKQIREGARLR
jgi:hypothetical protein